MVNKRNSVPYFDPNMAARRGSTGYAGQAPVPVIQIFPPGNAPNGPTSPGYPQPYGQPYQPFSPTNGGYPGANPMMAGHDPRSDYPYYPPPAVLPPATLPPGRDIAYDQPKPASGMNPHAEKPIPGAKMVPGKNGVKNVGKNAAVKNGKGAGKSNGARGDKEKKHVDDSDPTDCLCYTWKYWC